MRTKSWIYPLVILVFFELIFLIVTYAIDLRDENFPILDMMLRYDFDTFKRGVTIQSVLVYYYIFRILDMVFPIVYASFFINISGRSKYVIISIIIGAAFDYMENILQLFYILKDEYVTLEMILLMSATWMKFIWIIIAITLTIYMNVKKRLLSK